MTYQIAIERFQSNGEGDCKIEIISKKTGLTLAMALFWLRNFVLHHPDGYLLFNTTRPVEYETDGAELSCWIDFDKGDD